MLTATVLTDPADLAALRGEWQSLLERSDSNEPTLSPLWQLAWWNVFGPLEGRGLRAVLLHDGARLVGLAPLLARTHRYRLGVPFRRLELLASGEDEIDEICSEYIGVIAERGAEEAVAQTLAHVLVGGAAGPWDELSLPAMRGDRALPVLLGEALRSHGLRVETEVTGAAPYVPLPDRWEDYLSALPSSRRYLVRRSLRDFEAWAKGSARFERASSRADLARGQAILTALHGERWTASGSDGAFASARFRAFHGAVMPALLDAGALDLAWLTVHGEPVAVLYNLVWDGRVYFYQSGRKLDLPRGIRAGIVLHAYAMKDAIAAGRREYDFLAGTSRYKMDLALAARPLVRLRAVRPSLVEAARRTTELAVDQARALRDRVRRAWPTSA